ncbi:MAG: ethanolamine permease, partial [Bradyrhizobium sp.]|nr:ethanolamine permease [Bradyrhizobium sp.]
KAPLYPVLPAVALVCATLSLLTMVWFNLQVFAAFVVLFAAGLLLYRLTAGKRTNAANDNLLDIALNEARAMAD